MCKFKQVTCHKCNKKGHIAKLCHSSQSKPPSNRQGQPPRNSSLHQILQAQEALEDDSTDEVYALYNLPGSRTKPIQTIVSIGNQDLDTGASLSIISKKTYSSLNNAPQLQSTEARLRTYTVCGNYKARLNRALRSEIYPLPRIEELFTALAGGEQFSKLDLSHISSLCLRMTHRC